MSTQFESSEPEAPRSEENQTADSYRPPELTRHGSLKKIIRGNPTGNTTDDPNRRTVS